MSAARRAEMGTIETASLDAGIASRLKRDANGLFTAVAQERGTGQVLMVAWMDDDALARTLETRKATYFSRSRQRALGQGRDVRSHPVRALGAARLRRRHRAAGGRPGRRGLPHRRRTPASTPTSCWVLRSRHFRRGFRRPTHAGNPLGMTLPVAVGSGGNELLGDLEVPPNAGRPVVFAHGTGSSRFSPRNRLVAQEAEGQRLRDIYCSICSPQTEEQIDLRTREFRFDVGLLADSGVVRARPDARARAVRGLPVGLFGASTGAAAALIATAGDDIGVRRRISRWQAGPRGRRASRRRGADADDRRRPRSPNPRGQPSCQPGTGRAAPHPRSFPAPPTYSKNPARSNGWPRWLATGSGAARRERPEASTAAPAISRAPCRRACPC